MRDLIDQVRAKTDIVRVIGARIQLDSHNRALCPFHTDHNPSFSVNPKKQYFLCFGCRKGGDVFQFLQLFEKRPFLTVLQELAREAGIEIQQPFPEGLETIQEDRAIEEVLAATAEHYHHRLPSHVLDYLIRERGLTKETISRYRIGYADSTLFRFLTNECQFPVQLCFKAGVLRNRGSCVEDYFHNRIIFPNLHMGRVVHLTGRSLNGEHPKYLHIHGPIEYLYNEDALTEKEVYLVEGPFDCLSLAQAGFSTAALLGAGNFNEKHLQKLSLCEKVYVCLDGDQAGKGGALKIADLTGERARIVELPAGLDVDEYLKAHSVDEFKELAVSAKDLIRYRLSLIPRDIPKTELLDKLEPVMQKLACMDEPKAEAYLRYEIRPYFEMTNAEMEPYRRLLKLRRRSSNAQCAGDCAKESIYTAQFAGLIDLVQHKGRPAFLVKDGEELIIKAEIETDEALMLPPGQKNIPWLLPQAEEVITHYINGDDALYDDLFSYHAAISELPGDAYYDLFAAWDLHTYLPEQFQYSPIICLFAVPERGKSRTGKGLIHVAYRGIHVESMRDPYIVRVSRDFGASLFFDVMDIWKKAERNGSDDVLLHRFEKGAQVPRVMYPERGPHRDIEYFKIFGPTIVATNKGVHKILETRAISINMPEAGRRFERDVRPQDALSLKARLLAFRARYIDAALPETAKPANGRLGDILKPLLQMVCLVRPERHTAFMQMVSKLESERMTDESDSLEGHILEAIIRKEVEVRGNILPVKDIAEAINENRSEHFQVSSHTIGRRLKAMGFTKTRGGDGSAAIVWDNDKIEKMRPKYGLKESSDSSEPSEDTAYRGDGASESDDSEDSEGGK